VLSRAQRAKVQRTKLVGFSADAFHSLDKNGVDLLAPAAWQSHRRTLTIYLLVLFESRFSNLNDFAAYEILILRLRRCGCVTRPQFGSKE
jgi:hypothetical protein